jgi:hypothetical protein
VPNEIGGAVGRVWEAFASVHPGTDFTYIYEYLKTEDSGP